MTNSVEAATSNDGFHRKPDPFTNMCISDNRFLDMVSKRQQCPRCNTSRKFFCYTCYLPLPGVPDFPHVQLPIQIDIIKHHKEVDGKSTSAHARILAPHHCRIFQYPDIPDYTGETGVVLIYPSKDSRTVHSLFSDVAASPPGADDNFGMPAGFNIGTLLRWRLSEPDADDSTASNDGQTKNPVKTAYDLHNLPIKRAVFIDSTWNQSRSIYKDARVRALPSVLLQHRLSQFWRHHKGSPRWYLSTVEAVHQLLLEVHVYAWGLDAGYRGLERLEIGGPFADGGKRLLSDGDQGAENSAATLARPYCGQYDNLLFLFTHMYNLIHKHYDHNNLKAYKRPIT